MHQFDLCRCNIKVDKLLCYGFNIFYYYYLPFVIRRRKLVSETYNTHCWYFSLIIHTKNISFIKNFGTCIRVPYRNICTYIQIYKKKQDKNIRYEWKELLKGVQNIMCVINIYIYERKKKVALIKKKNFFV